MIPISVNSVDRFTPESAKALPTPPVYLLSPPSKSGKALWRRTCSAAGIIQWNLRNLIEAAKADINQMIAAGGDGEQTQAALEVCDRLVAEMELASKGGEPVSIKTLNDWGDVSTALRRVGGRLAGMVADNENWFELAPIVAAQIGLRGWENAIDRETQAVLTFAKVNDVVPDALIDRLDTDHAAAIGWKVIALMFPSETQAKNSEPPRLSTQGQINSDPASEQPTAAAGNSSATATTATPA